MRSPPSIVALESHTNKTNVNDIELELAGGRIIHA